MPKRMNGATTADASDQMPASLGPIASLMPAALLLAIGLCALAAATFAMADKEGRYLVVMRDAFDPATMMDLVYRSHGGVAGFARIGNGVFAVSDDPSFPDTMRAAGAWFVLPMPRIPGCFATDEVRP